MDRTILTGPAVLPAHASPLTASRYLRVFHDKENEFTQDPAKLTEEQFRGTVLRGVKEASDKTSTLVTDHAELKKQAEAAFKTLGDQTKTIQEQAQKLVSLEKALVAAKRNIDPRQDPKEYLKSAFPDECRYIAEQFRKRTPSFPLVQKADSTTTVGAVVPTDFSDVIYSRVVQYGAFKRLDCHPMSAQTEQLVVETDEPIAVFVPENGEIPETALGLSPVGVTAKNIAVILGVSNQLLQDSDVDLGAYISLKFTRACAARTDYAAYMSNGTSDAAGLNGGFTGLFLSGTAVVAPATHTTIGKLTLEDIIALVTSVPEAVLEASPAWFINPLLLPQFLGIVDGNGRPIFLNALEAPAYGAIGTILGAPVYPVSVAPSSNAAGQPVAAFGDPLAYAVGVRKDYQFDSSIHARFTSNQTVYRGQMRIAAKIKNAANIAVLETAAQ